MFGYPHRQSYIVVDEELVAETSNAEQCLDRYDPLILESNELHHLINTIEEATIGLDLFITARKFDFWPEWD